ncbi:related to ankyrin repeat [Fusarium torulosum]|uniref:Related to ankyrin repeat n=1 Tax=Fusarium torulosum TaxID=33205 RepID=A0AAE8MH73_9HYPO|nr:related to ankyrin repeat [Fusarium torulosum]
MSDPKKYTIGWICALTTEFVAARALLDEKHDQPESSACNDNNNYALGRIGKHNVVIAVLPKSEYGTTTAATVARDMLHSFPNVRFGLMVGIGGGAPSAKHDIRLGDVIVSTRGKGRGGVFQYDYGKAIQDHSFVATGSLNQSPQLLSTAVSALEAEYELEGQHLSSQVDKALEQRQHLRKKYSRPPPDSDKLYQSNFVHPDSSRECAKVCGDDPVHLVDRSTRSDQNDEPIIHYGLVASSNKVMEDALARDSLAASEDVLCFEMEAAGLMNHFPCIVIRGICDYSDSHKNKEWQGFAAMVAAAYAKDLLCQILPSKVEAEMPIRDALASMKTTGEVTRDVVISMKSDHHISKIERWLSAPDCSTNVNLARKQRHKGTGTWLLDSPAFQEWESGSRQHLWLYGWAGCGKTVLITTILDHLLSSDTHTTLSFFFDFNDPGKQRLENLLRSLAAQLYRSGNKATRSLDDLFASHNTGEKQPDTSALSACVNTMIGTIGKAYIIIDALDECTERSELIQWLETLRSNKAQLIITGRPEVEFEREIPQLINGRNCILLGTQAVNADIRSYVKATIEQRREFVDKSLSSDILEMIYDKVGNGADGMFRWAACQLDSLARCLSPRDIKTALNTLPQDLKETYRRILDGIPSEYKHDAIRLLQFLVHAKRPLKVSEAVEVIATQPDQNPPVFSTDGRLCQERDILRYCPSLVIIAEVERYDGTFEELHLAHFSVKEYLLEQAQFDVYCASIIITKTCLTYLSDINCDDSTFKDDFPMTQFSTDYWMDYAALAEDSEETVGSIISFLQDEKSLQRWIYLYEPLELDPCPGTFGAQKLYYACLCNLVVTVRYLVAEGADINGQYGPYGSALQTASFEGHLEIVKILIEARANVNVQGGFYGSALQAASAGGHLEVVQLLIKNGADVDVQGGEHGGALTAASYYYDLEGMQLLLENGADINMASGELGNALYVASEFGCTEAVRLLLSEGANVNAQGGSYGSALEAARSRGQSQIVQILLDHGAGVDNTKGGTLASLNYDRMTPRERSGSINIREKAKSRRI